jgi:hypothetical protein
MNDHRAQTNRHRRRARWCGLVGLALQPIGFLVMGSLTAIGQGTIPGILGPLLVGLGIVLASVGIWHYAKSKGYGNAVAALSFLYAYGLLILVLLPNRNR